MSMEGASSGLQHAIRFDENVRQYEPADDNNLEFYYRHRTTSLHRNLFTRPEATSVRSLGRNLEGRRHWVDAAVTMGRNPHERQVDEIVNKIEEDFDLVDDTQEAEQFRREALRDMPQSLTMKRSVKYKLLKNMDDRPHEGTIGCGKRTVYKYSMFCSKFKSGLYDFLYTFELWYKSLKKIEGQFGSAAATFFRFFRWLFLLNVFTCLVCLAFVTLPQILDTQYSNHLYASKEEFSVANLFTGEGYLTDTVLFYGFYTNETVVLWFDFAYSMPLAYFFTLGSIYIINFIILSISMARSYRRNFIETKGGLKNVFAHKIFCGWDFGIATKDAAELKASNIYNDLKELLVEYNSPSRTMTILMRFWTWTIQGIMHILVLILLGSMGYGMWTLLDENRLIPDTYIGVVTAIVVNVIMFVVPFLFIFISKFEDYKNPRTVFYITLTRTFLLELLVIGILVIYWILHADKVECWQTSLGQEIYRLIIFDFFFSVAFLVFTEIARSFIYKYVSPPYSPAFHKYINNY